MQEGFSTASNRIRELGFGAGMGLPNMKKYSDSRAVISAVGKGTRITMVIDL
jgi:anti-sigma regulatory factor (Ser/Thr protein kinase)